VPPSVVARAAAKGLQSVAAVLSGRSDRLSHRTRRKFATSVAGDARDGVACRYW
jgi:hypothetical protein